MDVALLMTVYHRSDREIYDMDEDRMHAILDTLPRVLKLLYAPRIG